MIWTLTFVAFLLNGGTKVGGGVFKSRGDCEAIRIQLIDAVEHKQMPTDAVAMIVGGCQIWTNPKADLHP